MKKLDIYLIVLTAVVILLIWRYDSANLVKIVLYLLIIIGLYLSIVLTKIKKKRKRVEVSHKGFVVLATGHTLLTLLFFMTGSFNEPDTIVSTGEFIIYLALLILFTLVVVANCSLKQDAIKQDES